MNQQAFSYRVTKNAFRSIGLKKSRPRRDHQPSHFVELITVRGYRFQEPANSHCFFEQSIGKPIQNPSNWLTQPSTNTVF
ncbi:MAG: hypothetical protein ACI87E_002618 [Mariniblastus sp.]|jgi:hypothetical protein